MFIVSVGFGRKIADRVVSNGGELGLVLNNLSNRRFDFHNRGRFGLGFGGMPPDAILSLEEFAVLLIRT
jgi:hypothetical protein